MKNKILVIACLVLVLCMSLVLPMATAFADYTEDVLNNPQAIVNFNQLFQNTFTHNYSLGRGANYPTDFILNNNEYYYIRIDVSVNNGGLHSVEYALATNDFTRVFDFETTGVYDYVFQCGRQDSRIDIYTRATDVVLNYGMLINLTQMFGVDSIPNVSQCRDLFVSDYYAYNTGTAVSISGLDSFNRGVNYVLNNVEITMTAEQILNYAQPYYASYKDSSIKYYTSTGNYPETRYTNELNFYNCAYVPLISTAMANTNFTFKALSVSDSNANLYPINIYLVKTNGDLVLFDYLYTDNNLILIDYNKSIVLQFDVIGVVFDNATTDNHYYGFSEIEFVYQGTSYDSLISSSYTNGYNAAVEYYNKLYAPTGSAYQAIYNKGYYDYPNDDHFTFKSLITSAVDVPVQAMTNLFDFDILGVNMKTFYLSVFTLCVIFVVLRLVL